MVEKERHNNLQLLPSKGKFYFPSPWFCTGLMTCSDQENVEEMTCEVPEPRLQGCSVSTFALWKAPVIRNRNPGWKAMGRCSCPTEVSDVREVNRDHESPTPATSWLQVLCEPHRPSRPTEMRKIIDHCCFTPLSFKVGYHTARDNW